MSPISNITGLDWLNENYYRNYPLSDESTGVDTSGTFTLPNDLIVDFELSIREPASYDPALFHLMEVAIFGEWIMIKIGYDGTQVGITSVAESSHKVNKSYFIQGVNAFEETTGKITIGRLKTTQESGGAFQFDVAGGRILPTLIRPDTKAVRGLVPVNNNEEFSLLDGIVNLVSGTNIQITPVELDNNNQIVDGGTDYNALRLDAVGTEEYETGCNCGNIQELPEPIYFINGIRPTSGGDYLLQGDDCITLSSLDNGTSLNDDCSKPCCGSDELDTLTSDQGDLAKDIRTLLNQVQQVETRLLSLESLKKSLEATGYIVP